MDTRGFIFVRPAKSGQALKDFAEHIFRWLGIPRFEERWGRQVRRAAVCWLCSGY